MFIITDDQKLAFLAMVYFRGDLNYWKFLCLKFGAKPTQLADFK